MEESIKPNEEMKKNYEKETYFYIQDELEALKINIQDTIGSDEKAGG